MERMVPAVRLPIDFFKGPVKHSLFNIAVVRNEIILGWCNVAKSLKHYPPPEIKVARPLG